MQQIKKLIDTLRASRYLTATIDVHGTINDINLLENGIKYSEELLNHWQQTHTLDKEADVKFTDAQLKQYDPLNNKYNIIKTEQFDYINKYLQNQENPVILKSIQRRTVGDEVQKRVHLVTDFVVHPAKGLSKFFNTQRRCKIWWMRLTYDPSKYILESNQFSEATKFRLHPGTQSIAIKSKFPYGTFTVEDLSFIPLHGGDSFSSADVQYINNGSSSSTQSLIPGVIRSVIDLHAAAAIILNSADNNRQHVLMLNRKIAPYQCAVACHHQGKHVRDLEDLCCHLNFVLARARLRLINDSPVVFTKSADELDTACMKCDSLGVPYMIIINESTLETGLLKLRSRDTTLEEIIHISDIPKYLLQIFHSS